MTGRTVKKHIRAYIDGYDLSSDAMAAGPLSTVFPADQVAAWDWEVKGGLPGIPEISMGTLNTILRTVETAANGGHDILPGGNGTSRVVMLPVGMRAAPAQGDPVFMGYFEQAGYVSNMEEGLLTVSVPLDKWSLDGSISSYWKAWGSLLHAKAAKTAVNTAVGIDDKGAASAAGGWMEYQIFAVSGTGTVTIKVQEADTNENASFGDVSGATSGALAHTAIPAAGIVQLSTTAAIKRYLRWQIELSGITSVTFALAFVRG